MSNQQQATKTDIEPESGRWTPLTEPAPDDVEGHVNKTSGPGIDPESGRRVGP